MTAVTAFLYNQWFLCLVQISKYVTEDRSFRSYRTQRLQPQERAAILFSSWLLGFWARRVHCIVASSTPQARLIALIAASGNRAVGGSSRSSGRKRSSGGGAAAAGVGLAPRAPVARSSDKGAETAVVFCFFSSASEPWGLFKSIWCFLCVVLGRLGSSSCGYFHAEMRGTRRTAKSDRSKPARYRRPQPRSNRVGTMS